MNDRQNEPVRTWPGVSVVMPILNEERHLRAAVAGVLDQHYPGDLELIMAIGPCDARRRTGRREPPAHALDLSPSPRDLMTPARV